MASMLEQKLAAALQSRQERGILRRLDSKSTGGVDFASNDYLSLTRDDRLQRAFIERLATSKAPVLGSGGSRLLVPAPAHAALETRLARLFNGETALLFNSGFDANVAFFQCVPQPGDIVLYDALVHASVHDGLRAGRARTRSFKHNDVQDLANQLSATASQHGSVFVAVESLYSMDGDRAPLQSIAEVLAHYGSQVHLVVDEAHATGVFGRGLVMDTGTEKHVLARLVTFGKALACTGAVLIMPAVLREYMLNYARPLIYTTALSNSCIIAIDCALDLLENGRTDELARQLHDNVRYLVSILPSGLVPESAYGPSPIVPILVQRPHALAAHLRTRGLVARAIAPPTVPKGAERVRICVQAGHTRAELDALSAAVAEWLVGERAKL